ncbi:MAG: chemotaxis protein CheW [Deltaproteobacteria bacterium]|nr:chemotaxis protein CheW [Deltaproteobacteria bacterium]MBI3388605.1 chemotaxis protein CheW [Deltaproteobacteria bacterium]
MASGKTDEIRGRAKEAAGALTGDAKLKRKGRTEHRMTNDRHLVIVALDDRQYALPLSAVDRVVRLVEITPLPEAPETILGVINVQGRIVPALSLRRSLHIPERDLRLSDQIIIASFAQRTVALVADAAIDVVEPPEHAVTSASAILSDIAQVDGVVKLAGALVPILNLNPDALLPLDTAGALPPDDRATVIAETYP